VLRLVAVGLVGIALFFLLDLAGRDTSPPYPKPAALCFADGGETLQVVHRVETAATPSYHRISEKNGGLAPGRFLVASRELIDLNFSQSVVLLIEYGPKGAMGLIINRPTEVRLSEALPDMEDLAHLKQNLFFGGPVAQNQILMLLRSDREIEGTHLVFEDVYASTSRAVLEEMVNHAGADDSFRVYAGYAGWAPGQLDQEFSRGDWHVLRADRESIFEKEAAQIWPELIRWSAGQWVKARPLPIRETSLQRLFQEAPKATTGDRMESASWNMCFLVSSRSGAPFFPSASVVPDRQ
jgi:putative transcriptional regulator